jgi:hypothetical protein
MNAKQVAVHEVDGRRVHVVLDGLVEYVAALAAEFADIGPVGGPGDLLPLRSHAFRTTAALLGVYRSRVDFLRHSALDTGGERFRDRFMPVPALTGPDPAMLR